MSVNTIAALRSRFPGAVLDEHSFRGEETAVIGREFLTEAAFFLRDACGFEFLMDLTAVDRLPAEPRFELVCHLYSYSRNARLRLKVPVDSQTCSVSSLCGIWPGANWFEREVYDMFGIKFEGHPDLRRLLMYDSFQGHPLRKDYPLKKRQPRTA